MAKTGRPRKEDGDSGTTLVRCFNDPAEMKVGSLGKFGVGDKVPLFTVFQIAGDTSMLVSYKEQLFWVEGLGTGKLADGDKVTFDGIVECPGNKQYTTALGATRTVLVIRCLTSK